MMKNPSAKSSPAFNLRCDWRSSPAGVDPSGALLSWQLPGETSAVELRLFLDSEAPDESTVHRKNLETPGDVVSYKLPEDLLEPDRLYFWQVKCGESGDWSETASFRTGPASAGDWAACEWIGDGRSVEKDQASMPSPLLRGRLRLRAKPVRAMLHASALGLYRAYCNGQRIGDREFAPEWTNYRKTVYYQSYEVSAELLAGENILAVRLADGWFAGQLGLAAFVEPETRRIRYFYGDRPAFIGRLVVDYEDGEREVFGSGVDWRVLPDGPLRFSDMVHGETVDLTREPEGWMQPGFDDAAWEPAVAVEFPKERLCGSVHPPVRVVSVLEPRSVEATADGRLRIDLGQNIAGWLRLRVRGRAGRRLRVRHAEVLDPKTGELYRDNLRAGPNHDFGARQEYCVTLDRDGVVELEPAFTYFGFRFAEIEGLDARGDLLDAKGCGVFTEAPGTYAFECSNPMLDRLMKAIEWTARDNMPSVPTDCPQRDERLGWSGDAQVFSQTACFQMDMAGFYRKWLRDVRETQLADGRFADMSPFPYELMRKPFLVGSPGWADVGVLLPWTAYVNYGDRRFLEDGFEPAGRYLDFIAGHNPQWLWKNRVCATTLEYGDWLNGDTLFGVEGYPKAGNATPMFLYATAFWAHSTRTYAKIARALGEDAVADEHERRLERILAAFCTAFVNDDGRVLGENQAVYAFALEFDLLPEPLRAGAFERMVQALDQAGNRLTTGIQSTIRLMNTLSRFGRGDLAYQLLLRTDVPSWGYMLKQGGTTIWERWDGYVEGRGFQTPVMNSFNHYAIGAVGEWMFRNILGLHPDETAPGWAHCFLRPVVGGALDFARGEHRTVRGTIRTGWSEADGRIVFRGELPPTCRATFEFPVAHAPGGLDVDAQKVDRPSGPAWACPLEPGPFELAWSRH